jgi:Lrp/AsnC family leucine-responsive transcriptional regulator
MNFDAIDRQILLILREEGRASHAALAKAVGLSAPAVGERVRKLEQAGVIRGYRAVLDPDALGLDICAFVAIAPQPRKPAADLVERLMSLPEIEELHAVAGNYAYIAKVRVASTQALDGFLDRLFMMEGVERTETTMVLRTNAERPMHLPFETDERP